MVNEGLPVQPDQTPGDLDMKNSADRHVLFLWRHRYDASTASTMQLVADRARQTLDTTDNKIVFMIENPAGYEELLPYFQEDLAAGASFLTAGFRFSDASNVLRLKAEEGQFPGPEIYYGKIDHEGERRRRKINATNPARDITDHQKKTKADISDHLSLYDKVKRGKVEPSQAMGDLLFIISECEMIQQLSREYPRRITVLPESHDLTYLTAKNNFTNYIKPQSTVETVTHLVNGDTKKAAAAIREMVAWIAVDSLNREKDVTKSIATNLEDPEVTVFSLFGAAHTGIDEILGEDYGIQSEVINMSLEASESFNQIVYVARENGVEALNVPPFDNEIYVIKAFLEHMLILKGLDRTQIDFVLNHPNFEKSIPQLLTAIFSGGRQQT